MMNCQKIPRLSTAICILLVFGTIGCRPVYETRIPKFAEDVKKVVDSSELQEWAVKVLAEQKSDAREIPRENVPASIRDLSSQGSPFQWAAREQNCVRLVWGGGFGHWGILVGTPSFRPAQDGNYFIEWKSGIYFWHQTR
jgi:hypothetical protein